MTELLCGLIELLAAVKWCLTGNLPGKRRIEGFLDELQLIKALQGIFGPHSDNGGGITGF